MSFLSLGKLPASDSPGGKLNELDYQKIARLAVVVFVGAFCTAVSASGLTDANLQTVLYSALQAGLSALGAAAIEAIRRFVTNQ